MSGPTEGSCDLAVDPLASVLRSQGVVVGGGGVGGIVPGLGVLSK